LRIRLSGGVERGQKSMEIAASAAARERQLIMPHMIACSSAIPANQVHENPFRSACACGRRVRRGAGGGLPARPVRLVVPYAAGGNADIFGRTLAQKLGSALMQPFVVENRAGANGGIGADFVAKSAPDGYALLVTASGPIVVNPVLYAKVPYDPVRDFAPVAQCTVYQYVLVTLAGSPIKSIVDLVDAARARPGPSPTVPPGSAAATISPESCSRSQRVPSSRTCLTRAARRRSPTCSAASSLSCSTRSSRRFRRSAPESCARSQCRAASALESPRSTDDAGGGHRGFDISQWQGVLAPVGTPKVIVDRLNAELVKAMRSADVRERIVTQAETKL